MEALHGTGYRPTSQRRTLSKRAAGPTCGGVQPATWQTTPVSALRLPSRSRTSLPRLLQSRIHCTARFWTILRAEGRPCSRPLRAISRRCTRQAPKKPSEAKQRPCHKREGSNIGWGHTQTVSEWFSALAADPDAVQRPCAKEHDPLWSPAPSNQDWSAHPTHTSSLSKTSVSNVKVVAVKPLSWKTGKCQSSLAFARRPEGKFAGPVRSSCGLPGRESLFKVAATKVEVYPQAPKLLPGGLSSHQRGNPPEGQPGV